MQTPELDLQLFATLSNFHSNTLLSGTSNADSIRNGGNYVSITSGAGNDTVYNSFGDYVTIDGGTGNDYIRTFGYYDDSDYGDLDSLEEYYINEGRYIIINGGAGNDTVDAYSQSHTVTVYGGDGNDLIRSFGKVVNGGKGNDTIFIADEYMEWDDEVDHGKVEIEYVEGEGDDVVVNFDANDTLNITSGVYTTTKSGDDVVVKVGSGSITLKDAVGIKLNITKSNIISNTILSGTSGNDTINNSARNVTISAGAGNDSVCSTAYYVTVNAGAGNDTVRMTGDYVSVNGGAGNDLITNASISNYCNTLRGGDGSDSIFNYGYMNYVDGGAGSDYIYNRYYRATLSGGEGNDVIYSFHTYNSLGNSINGGAGNDSIYARGNYNTLRGSTGNDTILGTGSYRQYRYADGDGNDLIYNFDSTDTIRITNNSSYRTLTSGSDFIVSVGSGAITLKGVSNANIYGGILISDTIENTLNGVKITGGALDDYIINGGAGVTINVNAGDDTVQTTGDSVSVNGGEGNDSIISNKYSAEGKNVTVLGGAGADSIFNYGSMTYIDGGADRDYIYNENYGVTIFGGEGQDVIYSFHTYNSRGNSINGGAGNDSIYARGNYNTLRGSTGNDTMRGSGSYRQYRYMDGDGKDVIYNFGSTDTIRITNDSSYRTLTSGSDFIVSVGSGAITLKDVSSAKIYGGTFISDTIRNSANGVSVKGTSAADYIINSGEGITIQGNGGDDTLVGSEFGELYLFGSADGNDLITNFGINDSIKITAGKVQSINHFGNDLIVRVKGTNYTGNMTLAGAGDYVPVQSGAYITLESSFNPIVNGNDNTLVVGTSSADYITNTGERVTIQSGTGNDTIEGSDDYGELYLFSSADGNNVITNFGENDTLKMSAGKTLTFATVGSDVAVSLQGAKYSGTVTLLGAGNLNFKQSGNVLIVNPDTPIVNWNNGVTFSGTGGADYMINSGERVTIEGKGGNDTIEGSGFGEMILFGSSDGGDYVTDFGANDTLRITAGSVQSTVVNNNDIVVNVKGAKYAGAITLGGAAASVKSFKKDGNYLYISDVNNIVNKTSNKKLVGTSGRDFIVNSGSGVTIRSGGGNDTIEGSDFGELYLFSSADGDNVITNFGKGDSLRCTAGSIKSYSIVDDDVIFTLQGTNYTGTVRLIDAADYAFKQSGKTLTIDTINVITRSADSIKITGTGGADSIVSSGQYVTIQSNGGNDTITGSDDFGELYLFASNHGDNVITNFGKGDTLKCTAGSLKSLATVDSDVIVTLQGTSYTGHVTLVGAAQYSFGKSGNVLTVNNVNTIENSNDDTLLTGTSDADRIINTGERVTIASGGGADTIIGRYSTSRVRTAIT